MVRYKRFQQTCTTDSDFQNFYNSLTAEDWRIIYYIEVSRSVYGDKEFIHHVTCVCEKSE